MFGEGLFVALEDCEIGEGRMAHCSVYVLLFHFVMFLPLSLSLSLVGLKVHISTDGYRPLDFFRSEALGFKVIFDVVCARVFSFYAFFNFLVMQGKYFVYRTVETWGLKLLLQQISKLKNWGLLQEDTNSYKFLLSNFAILSPSVKTKKGLVYKWCTDNRNLNTKRRAAKGGTQTLYLGKSARL